MQCWCYCCQQDFQYTHSWMYSSFFTVLRKRGRTCCGGKLLDIIHPSHSKALAANIAGVGQEPVASLVAVSQPVFRHLTGRYGFGLVACSLQCFSSLIFAFSCGWIDLKQCLHRLWGFFGEQRSKKNKFKQIRVCVDYDLLRLTDTTWCHWWWYLIHRIKLTGDAWAKAVAANQLTKSFVNWNRNVISNVRYTWINIIVIQRFLISYFHICHKDPSTLLTKSRSKINVFSEPKPTLCSLRMRTHYKLQWNMIQMKERKLVI